MALLVAAIKKMVEPRGAVLHAAETKGLRVAGLRVRY